MARFTRILLTVIIMYIMGYIMMIVCSPPMVIARQEFVYRDNMKNELPYKDSYIVEEPIEDGENREQNISPYVMTVHKAPLSSVVEGISKSYGLSIIGVDSLKGMVSGTIHGETPEAMLQSLGKQYNFSIHKDRDIIRVSMVSESQRHISVIEPAFIPVQSLEKSVKTIVPSDKVSTFTEGNMMVVHGTDNEMENVNQLVQLIDKEIRQVRLEVTVMAMEQSYRKETGLRWSWQSIMGHGGDMTHSYGAISFGRAPSGESYRFFVKPELSLMESSGRAVVVASPSIMTVNGEAAHILIGERIPVIEESITEGERKHTVRYEEAGIRLDYTPMITKQNTIDAIVQAEVSSPVLVSELKAYKITTRQAKTRVRMKDGEVLIIGGLMDNRNQRQMEKIPILGDIPLLGKLFRHSRKTKDSVEMIIFVKATVV